jgi:hypothetical protein
MAAPTGPFSEYAPTAAGIKRLPAYTLQPSGHVSLRSGHRRLPNKNAPAAFLESARGIGLDKSPDAFAINRNPL